MTATLLAADLARVLDDAALFAGRDSAIPVINSVQLESTPKQLIAVATDRFTMGASVARYHADKGDGPTFLGALKLPHAQLVAKVAKSTKAAFTDVSVEVVGDSMKFSFTTGEELTVPKLVASTDYPDWRRVIESSRAVEDGSTPHIAVNPQYLAKFGRVNGARNMMVKFSGVNRPALVTIGVDFFGLIMPTRMDDKVATELPEWLARPEPVKPEPKKRAPRKSRAKAAAA